jgi:hypothetical protein
MKKTIVDGYLEQVVDFFGYPLRRGDVYLHLLSIGMSKRGADACAFSYSTPIDEEPWLLEEFSREFRAS